jgi:hypothetical protein
LGKVCLSWSSSPPDPAPFVSSNRALDGTRRPGPTFAPEDIEVTRLRFAPRSLAVHGENNMQEINDSGD